MWTGTHTHRSLDGIQQTVLQFDEDSSLEDHAPPGVRNNNCTKCHDTTQPYMKDGGERVREQTGMQCIVLSDLDNSNIAAAQAPVDELGAGTPRVLFASGLDFTSFCSVEEKPPRNAEVAARHALIIHSGARKILQTYRSLKFAVEQQIYRCYFMRWLKFHWMKGLLDARVQTAALWCSTPQMSKRLSEDCVDGFAWDTVAKSTPLSAPNSVKYGLSSTGRSGSNRRPYVRSDDQPCESTTLTPSWDMAREPASKFAYGAKSGTPVSSTSPSNKDSSIYSCNVSSIRPDRGTPQRDEFPCLRLPELGTPRSRSLSDW